MSTGKSTIKAITAELSEKIARAEQLQNEAMQVFEKTTLTHDEHKEYSAQLLAASFMSAYLFNVLKCIVKDGTVSNAKNILKVHADQQKLRSANSDKSDMIAFSRGLIGKVLSDIYTIHFAA